jgi:putative methionine-R-sulfoxide reductase with GAF domain
LGAFKVESIHKGSGNGGPMIYRYLRKLTVRRRVFGVLLVFIMSLALSVPLVVITNVSLVSRLEQISNVDTRIDRLLLLASGEILASRVNLMRYTSDIIPAPSEALNNVATARQYITEARQMITAENEQKIADQLLEGISLYEQSIRDIQSARSGGKESDITNLIFTTAFQGKDMELLFEKILESTGQRVAAANAAVLGETRTRLLTFLIVNAGIFVTIIAVGFVFAVSLTRPIAELREGAEAFRLKRRVVSIPEDGKDELSELARTFNQLTVELSEMYESQEQTIIERTRAVELGAEVSRRLSTILDRGELVQAVVNEIQSAFSYYHAQIYLLDENRRNLIMVGGTGEAGQIMLGRGHTIPEGKGLVGRAAKYNQVVYVPNTTTDPNWLPNPLLPETRSEVALPIAIGEQVLGVLDVQNNVVGSLTDQDMGLLKSISNQVAVAVRNTQLYEMAQRQAERETLVNTISQQIQSATTIDSVLQVAVRELGKVLGAQKAGIQIGGGPLAGDGHS